ncbi:hypothetical protein H2O73_06060 [Vibrio sp. 404]|uniref:Uncharacterized protein n=1 Tax=Vibrio marinisediminis TaxID=2758441 RepID=A0A7W2FPI2_9VIBR|nr:hypothetical protein [Vibrio marinisediminis]MBA5761910.1 hypothetical protein [Vibrio marinisediminis]
MGEKVKVKVITDTTLVDGVYQTEARSGKDRRKNRQMKWRFYERRSGQDPRNPQAKQINETI